LLKINLDFNVCKDDIEVFVLENMSLIIRCIR